jgi:hypothetical protein
VATTLRRLQDDYVAIVLLRILVRELHLGCPGECGIGGGAALPVRKRISTPGSQPPVPPAGAQFSPQQLWDLAQRWYDDRFELDWRRRSVAEWQRILDDVGLTGESWSLATD